jgi:hypothetical protein
MTVIVYILSKTKKGWKELQAVIHVKSDNGTKRAC